MVLKLFGKLPVLMNLETKLPSELKTLKSHETTNNSDYPYSNIIIRYAKNCLFYQFNVKYEPDKCICGFHGKYSIIEIYQKKI